VSHHVSRGLDADEAAKEQRWIEAHPNPETPRKPPPNE
jgi:hypothetical protein